MSVSLLCRNVKWEWIHLKWLFVFENVLFSLSRETCVDCVDVKIISVTFPIFFYLYCQEVGLPFMK